MNHLDQKPDEKALSLSSLETLLQAGTSPFHVAAESIRRLKDHGFTELFPEDSWELSPGESYFVRLYGSGLVAFTANDGIFASRSKTPPAFRIGAAHTDWPCLRIKPAPELSRGGYGLLNVECYGGMLLNTWFDRPLSMAGRVCLKTGDPFAPKVKLLDFRRPLLLVPSLAPHIRREKDKAAEPNKQTDLLPVFTRLTEQLEADGFFLSLLASECSCKPEEILDFEIYVYNWEKGTRFGLQNEFYASPRLDNLTSVEACLSGIIAADAAAKETASPEGHSCPGGTGAKNVIPMIALFDNEEVGNATKQGAASAALDRFCEKLYLALGYSREQYLGSMFQSFLLSMDVAHGFHPSKPENYDLKNHPALNDGVVIKMASSQSYATDSTAVSVLESLCKNHSIPYGKFSNRSDIRGGSTLGSISSCLLSVKAADVGVGLLAMHSAMETMGAGDQWALNSLLKAFFLD